MRDSLVRLFRIGDKAYEIRDRQDNVLVDSDNDYFIYLKQCNFKNDNFIDGIYLGQLEENSSLIDRHCKTVTIKDGRFTVDGELIRKARMVAINNKTNVIVVIQG